MPPKLNSRHKAFLARIVDEGPIPAIHGVVRWRACGLIFGLSVSDDTIYRALKKLGFSHTSARPKAYRQNAEAMDAFKKLRRSIDIDLSFNRIVAPSVAPSSSAAHLGHRHSRR